MWSLFQVCRVKLLSLLDPCALGAFKHPEHLVEHTIHLPAQPLILRPLPSVTEAEECLNTVPRVRHELSEIREKDGVVDLVCTIDQVVELDLGGTASQQQTLLRVELHDDAPVVVGVDERQDPKPFVVEQRVVVIVAAIASIGKGNRCMLSPTQPAALGLVTAAGKSGISMPSGIRLNFKGRGLELSQSLVLDNSHKPTPLLVVVELVERGRGGHGSVGSGSCALVEEEHLGWWTDGEPSFIQSFFNYTFHTPSRIMSTAPHEGA